MITIFDSLPKDRHAVSASQITTYKRCPRKWGFKYLDKLPDPPANSRTLRARVLSSGAKCTACTRTTSAMG
jgi:hypothetical protein